MYLRGGKTKKIMKYSNYTDEELAFLAKTDENALERLMEKYKPMINAQARSYFLNSGDIDDLVQEGMIGVFKAITSFSGKASFKTYVFTCVKTSIISAIKKSNRIKHKPLNNYVSLSGSDGDDADKTLLISDKNFDPEKNYIEIERENELKKEIKDSLSEFEHKILVLYLQGFSYADISEKTGKNEKSIDNAIQRIRKKLTKLNG